MNLTDGAVGLYVWQKMSGETIFLSLGISWTTANKGWTCTNYIWIGWTAGMIRTVRPSLVGSRESDDVNSYWSTPHSARRFQRPCGITGPMLMELTFRLRWAWSCHQVILQIALTRTLTFEKVARPAGLGGSPVMWARMSRSELHFIRRGHSRKRNVSYSTLHWQIIFRARADESLILHCDNDISFFPHSTVWYHITEIFFWLVQLRSWRRNERQVVITDRFYLSADKCSYGMSFYLQPFVTPLHCSCSNCVTRQQQFQGQSLQIRNHHNSESTPENLMKPMIFASLIQLHYSLLHPCCAFFLPV